MEDSEALIIKENQGQHGVIPIYIQLEQGVDFDAPLYEKLIIESHDFKQQIDRN